jgi:DNA-binding NarL/FixJ family response regulator
MSGGTLVVSRGVLLFEHFEERFKQLGFKNVTFTNEDKDALNFRINEIKPSLLIVSSGFYDGGTPYMMGGLHKIFPNLNIAVVALHDYPLSLAPWFIFHGVKSFLNMWEGYKEFHRGLQIVREGGEYISPIVKEIIEAYPEWPDVKSKITKRQYECLVMLCCGLEMKSIGNSLHIHERTVYHFLEFLYSTFHVSTREEMVALAWDLELITKKDVRFYDHKRDKENIPEWAKIQIKVNKKIKALELIRDKRVAFGGAYAS